ncbi:zinc-dependent peptidase [Thiorhodococcus fuscus]|uniref:Zinc-dependent peptidase n=1 Tax=Thiorhodococcus fuscus TaxID=527200 RepID=A0ABW4Y3G7_9GAMM
MRHLMDWWRSRGIARERTRFDSADWSWAWKRLPLLDRLDKDTSERLADLAMRFLRDKTLEPAQGLVVTDRMRLTIAFQAALPILELGLDWYRGWYSVILYPDVFMPEHQFINEDGLVQTERESRSGESWSHGPVILSWADIKAGGKLDGYNVVLHELAHKLDARSGATNGCPPLHADMSAADWKEAFISAFDDLCQRVSRNEDTAIDPYASESPAEFFAVATEAFFEIPDTLATPYPEVYRQLRAFYRQDPLRASVEARP